MAPEILTLTCGPKRIVESDCGGLTRALEAATVFVELLANSLRLRRSEVLSRGLREIVADTLHVLHWVSLSGKCRAREIPRS